MTAVDAMSVRRWATDKDSGEVADRTPPAALSGAVSSYRGFCFRSAEPVRRLELPISASTLVIGWAGPTRISDATDRASATPGLVSMVSGMHSRATVAEYDNVEGIQVTMSPLYAQRIFGVAMHELSERIVDLTDLTGRWGVELGERLADLPTWADRFDVLDQVLERRLQQAPDSDERMTWAWRRMLRTNGNLGIAELADQSSCSRRYLERRFRDCVGLSPKTAGRVLRLRQALRLLATPSATLTEVASACGYYDQAHLNLDFNRMVGCTPARFRRDRTADAANSSMDRVVDQVTSVLIHQR